MTKFRPCIDLHNGKVKQIVGGTLTDTGEKLRENFVSSVSAADYAEMYHNDKLTGGHIIQLGPGNQDAALSALAAWRGGLQIGGGIQLENAAQWLEAGASHVIVTSWLFSQEGHFLDQRLSQLVSEIGREHLVIDLSCRRTATGWSVAMNRWQTITNFEISHANLTELSGYCSEYLIHAADVEGLCQGIDMELVSFLGHWAHLPMTYAGGVRNLSDLKTVDRASNGSLDVTVGSALDIFGGSGVGYDELVSWNQRT